MQSWGFPDWFIRGLRRNHCARGAAQTGRSRARWGAHSHGPGDTSARERDPLSPGSFTLLIQSLPLSCCFWLFLFLLTAEFLFCGSAGLWAKLITTFFNLFLHLVTVAKWADDLGEKIERMIFFATKSFWVRFEEGLWGGCKFEILPAWCCSVCICVRGANRGEAFVTVTAGHACGQSSIPMSADGGPYQVPSPAPINPLPQKTCPCLQWPLSFIAY